MEIFRLSPTTGKALRHLNVMQGQILHGRVYRMERYGQSMREGNAGAGSGGKGASGEITDTGGIAKIALGSHLVEAVVSKSLPEGARVTLEVIKLADESFTLRLIEVLTAKSGDTAAQTSDGGKPSLAQPASDQIVLSPLAQESISDTSSQSSTVQNSAGKSQVDISPTGRIVELPEFADLPKALVQNIRAAISEGFINPADFTVKIPTVRFAIQQAVDELQTTLAQLPQSSTAAVKELAESINSIIKMLRPLIVTIPAGGIEIGESIDVMAGVLKDIAAALKPSLPAQTSGAGTAEAGQASSRTQPAWSSGTSPTVQSNQPAQTSASPAQPATSPTAPTAQTPGQTSVPVEPPQVSAGLEKTGLPPPADTARTIIDHGQIIDAKGKPSSEIENASRDAGDTRSQISGQSRNILFGMRMLATLADRIARAEGWNVEQSSVLQTHASHLSTLANALEGTIVAPIMAHAFDSPDLIPRLLLSLLFPGGHAEFGILQPDKSADSRHGKDESEDSRGDESRCVGVIRISTDGLGEVAAKLNYREIDEDGGDERKITVSGHFTARPDIADEIRSALNNLDNALDARGIESNGFRVIGLEAPANNEKLNDETNDEPPSDNETGGLDIRI